MGNFLAGLWLGTKALFTKPLEYLTDPVGTTEELYREDLEKSGISMEEIDQAVKAYEDSGGPVTDIMKGYGAATKAVGNAVKSIGGILDFLGKNFTLVLIIIICIVIGWYFLIARRTVSG